MNRQRGAPIVGTALLSLIMVACAGPACDKQVLYAAPAPDGSVIAFIYRRSCGAPSVSSTHVALVPFNGSLHDAPGNVLALAGEQPVKVAWRSPTQLSVTGFKDPLFQRSMPFGAINIEFPAMTAP